MATEKQSTEFPKRVMLVIQSMRGGGSERQMSYLANELVTRSVTSLVTLDETGNDTYLLDSRIERFGLKLTTSRGGFFRGLFAKLGESGHFGIGFAIGNPRLSSASAIRPTS